MSKWTIAGIVTAAVAVLTTSHVVTYRIGRSNGIKAAEAGETSAQRKAA